MTRLARVSRFVVFCVALNVVLIGCGKENKNQFVPPVGPPVAGDVNMAKMASDAKFDFYLVDAKTASKRTFVQQHNSECKLYKDQISRRMVFSVKFLDAATTSGIELRVVTRATDLGREDIMDTQHIYGIGESTGNVNISTGPGGGRFWNNEFTYENSPLVRSSCDITYTLSTLGVKATIYCENLINSSGQKATGKIEFSCDANLQPRSATPPSTVPAAGTPTTLPQPTTTVPATLPQPATTVPATPVPPTSLPGGTLPPIQR